MPVYNWETHFSQKNKETMETKEEEGEKVRSRDLRS